MRFFTDQFYSEEQKSKLRENSHLIERPSIRPGEFENLARHSEPVFYMEWQQEDEQAGNRDVVSDSAAKDLSTAVVTTLVGVFGIMFVFDVLLK